MEQEAPQRLTLLRGDVQRVIAGVGPGNRANLQLRLAIGRTLMETSLLKFKVWDWDIEELKPDGRQHLTAVYRANGVTTLKSVFLPITAPRPPLLLSPDGLSKKCVRPVFLGLSTTINPACDREPDALFVLGPPDSINTEGEDWGWQSLNDWGAEFDAREAESNASQRQT